MNNHGDCVLEDPDQDQINLVEVELVAENFEYCVSFKGVGIPAPVDKDAAAYPITRAAREIRNTGFARLKE